MKKIFTICFILNLCFLGENKGQGIDLYQDMLIAHDSIHSVTYDEQTVWSARRMLMEKLLNDTSLVSEDTSITNFYNAHLSDNIGMLSSVRVGINSMSAIDSTTAATIMSNLALIHSNVLYAATQDSILANDTTLSGSDSLAIDSLILICNDSIVAYAAVNDSINNIMITAINAKADSIKSVNDALTTDKIYEQNEIDVNSIYLGTIAKGFLDSVNNYSTALYNIATQCPLSGGPAVFYARSLYHLINDSINYDDDRMCGSPSDTCLVPPTPGVISGKWAGVCGLHLKYSIDTVLTATSYTWSVAGGASIDSGQGTLNLWVSFPDTLSTAIISVYASDSCGAGAARSIGITGFPAAPDSISGSSGVCAYATGLSFSADSSCGATSYTWVVPSGCTIDSGQGTTRIVVDWDSVPGNVQVVASNNCGSSDTTSYYVGIVACRESGSPRHIANNGSAGDIKVYPNPTNGDVTVIYHLSSSKGLLQLYDVVGKMVGSFWLDGNSNAFEFDASYLCCGIFEYRVIDDQNLKGQGKLVIIR